MFGESIERPGMDQTQLRQTLSKLGRAKRALALSTNDADTCQHVDYAKERTIMNNRYSSRTPVKCVVTFSADGVVGEGRVLNLSVPGCLIETSANLKIGQYLHLQLRFSEGHAPLRIALAVVRRIGGMLAGLELIRMSNEDQLRLRYIVGYQDSRKVISTTWSEAIVLMGGDSW